VSHIDILCDLITVWHNCCKDNQLIKTAKNGKIGVSKLQRGWLRRQHYHSI